MFSSDISFLTAKYRPMSRVLNLFKAQGEPKSKGKTPKKSATHCTCDDSSKILHKHHAPGPALKSFVLKGVCKVSNDESPSVSINNQDQAGPSSANDLTTSSSGVKHRSPFFESASALGDRTKKPPTHEFNGSCEPCDKENARESLNLLLGQQNTNAAYFTRRYVALPCSQRARIPDRTPSEILHYCDELDPEAFEAYRLYRKTGRLKFSCSEDVGANKMWMACWPIMNAVILSHILREPGFADRAMDILVERLAPGICPDIETIKQLFDESHTIIPVSLRNLAIDRFLDALPHSSSDMEILEYPSSFQCAILHAALGRLSHRSDPVADSSCDCHSHGATEACHKQKPENKGTLKGKERAHAFEELAEDAEAVARSIEGNGTNTPDRVCRFDIVTPRPERVRESVFLPLLPIVDSRADSGVTVVPSVRANDEQPRSQAGGSSEKPPDHVLMTSAAAGLDRISIAGTPFATNLGLRHNRSLGRTFRAGGQAKPDLAGHNGAQCGVITGGKPMGNDLPSSKQVVDHFKEYRECPGAYPESL